MSCVERAVHARAHLGDAFLVARKLHESAEFFLREAREYAPEVLDVGVGLRQSHLIHRVDLQETGTV